jgi:predicted secreted protein
MVVRAGRVIGALLVLATVGLGCSPTPSQGPTITVSCAEFETAPGGLVVKPVAVPGNTRFGVVLCSNASTGFSWEEPTWEGDAEVQLVERGVAAPVGGAPGEPGQERFVFDATGVGSEAIHFVYSQPWEGGTKGAWRFDLDVSVD